MSKSIKYFFFLCLVLLCFSCEKQKQTAPLIFQSNGKDRQYYLHRPPSLSSNSPLVFVLHGLGGTASGIREYSQMDAIANKYGFAVCYPQGTGGSKDTRYTKKGDTFWNVGYETHRHETVDDVSFIISLAKHLQKKYNLDPEKTFCSGMSNGGDMSYLLGCEASDIFRAIAPITGCMMGWIYDSCNKNDPVPVFQVHGTADKTTLYDGDENNRDKWGAYMGVETTIRFWVDRNECTESSIDTLPDVDKNDGGIVIAKKHIGGKNNNEVWFYKVINGDHEWPPGWPKRSGNGDLNTSEEIWQFFQHTINTQVY